MATTKAVLMSRSRSHCGVAFLLLGLAVYVLSLGNFAHAISDPDETLDFCVADGGQVQEVWQTGTEEGQWSESTDPTKMGVATIVFNQTTDSDFKCKDIKAVTVKDFIFKGLANAAKVTAKVGSTVTPANVMQFPAVNTLQISAARIDFIGGGLNPPHIHPRATEVLFVLSGSLVVGFVDTSNVLFTQELQTGDFFVFPKGTLHFQIEKTGKEPASALAGLNSQNPGTLQEVKALFDSEPPISGDVLKTAFDIDQKTLGSLLASVGSL